MNLLHLISMKHDMIPCMLVKCCVSNSFHNIKLMLWNHATHDPYAINMHDIIIVRPEPELCPLPYFLWQIGDRMCTDITINDSYGFCEVWLNSSTVLFFLFIYINLVSETTVFKLFKWLFNGKLVLSSVTKLVYSS